MRRFLLAPDAPEVSRMACGMWRLAEDPEGTDPKRMRAKIDACLENGITTFDHADIYGLYTCEGIFGRALAEAPALRSQMEIVTKCGINVPCENRPNARVPHYDSTPAAIERCVERSLRELHVDYIDLLLIHRPDWLTSAEETARGLEQVCAAGKVRSVGVSNYSTHQYALLAHFLSPHRIATNQVEISLLAMGAIYDGTLDQCQAHGSHPMAWSPLAKGQLITGDDEAARRTRAALARLAPEYGATPEQLAHAWVAALPCAPQVVIGTNKIDRIKEAAASEKIELDRQHWFELWEAAQGRRIP
jgi:predicted oxidoreductase